MTALFLGCRAWVHFGRRHQSGLHGGRQPDVELETPKASRKQALVLRNWHGQVFLMDIGSTHGTFLGKERLTPHIPKAWKPGVAAYFADKSVEVFELRPTRLQRKHPAAAMPSFPPQLQIPSTTLPVSAAVATVQRPVSAFPGGGIAGIVAATIAKSRAKEEAQRQKLCIGAASTEPVSSTSDPLYPQDWSVSADGLTRLYGRPKQPWRDKLESVDDAVKDDAAGQAAPELPRRSRLPEDTRESIESIVRSMREAAEEATHQAKKAAAKTDAGLSGNHTKTLGFSSAPEPNLVDDRARKPEEKILSMPVESKSATSTTKHSFADTFTETRPAQRAQPPSDSKQPTQITIKLSGGAAAPVVNGSREGATMALGRKLRSGHQRQGSSLSLPGQKSSESRSKQRQRNEGNFDDAVERSSRQAPAPMAKLWFASKEPLTSKSSSAGGRNQDVHLAVEGASGLRTSKSPTSRASGSTLAKEDDSGPSPRHGRPVSSESHSASPSFSCARERPGRAKDLTFSSTGERNHSQLDDGSSADEKAIASTALGNQLRNTSKIVAKKDKQKSRGESKGRNKKGRSEAYSDRRKRSRSAPKDSKPGPRKRAANSDAKRLDYKRARESKKEEKRTRTAAEEEDETRYRVRSEGELMQMGPTRLIEYFKMMIAKKKISAPDFEYGKLREAYSAALNELVLVT